MHRGHLWYRVDSDAGAWYWRKGELEDMVNSGMGGLLDETDQNRADAALEEAGAGGPLGEETIAYQQFTEMVMRSMWTLEADAQLVKLVNAQCDVAGVSPVQLSLQLPRADEGYPEWFTSAPDALTLLRARFAVLLSLNRRLSQLLPLIDFTVVKPSTIVPFTESIVYPSALGRRMASLRSLAFTRTKTSFWNTVLAATVYKTQQASGQFAGTLCVVSLLCVTTAVTVHVQIHSTALTVSRSCASTASRPRSTCWRPSRTLTLGCASLCSASCPSSLVTGPVTTSSGVLLSFVVASRPVPMIFSSVWRRYCPVCRDYSHSQDAGQQRSFFVKLIGEGVFDNGGPYRAVLNAACGEEPSGPLEFVVQCPNAANGGSNRDVMVFNPYLSSSAHMSRLRLWGKMSGMMLRQDMLVPISFPMIMWKAMTGQHVNEGDLAEIDERSAKAFQELDACIQAASSVSELQSKANTLLLVRLFWCFL